MLKAQQPDVVELDLQSIQEGNELLSCKALAAFGSSYFHDIKQLAQIALQEELNVIYSEKFLEGVDTAINAAGPCGSSTDSV